MEHPLRCNSLKCRRELNDQAVVTTCSHIFCLDCANRLHLSDPPPGQRPICPACEVHLINPDDAVMTNLNPTEDYKTSVLSGLSPHVIMECAGRALSFWAYQTTQELVYHDYLAKTLTEKYAKLNAQLDKVVHDANSEIHELRGKVANLHGDKDVLHRKYAELLQAYKERGRKQMHTQELYDKLKHRAMIEQVQDAATEAVDDTIHASAISNRFDNRTGDENQLRRQPPLFSGMRADEMQQPMRTHEPVGTTPAANRRMNSNHNSMFSSQESHNDTISSATPSSHRQRLANLGPRSNSGMGMNIQQAGRSMMPATPALRRRSPAGRSPLGGLSGNAVSGNGFAGYGMSAGVKFSQPPSRTQNYGVDPRMSSVPPRVAQRPASGWSPGFLGGTNGSGQNLPNAGGYY